MSVLIPTLCRRTNFTSLFNLKHRYYFGRKFVLYSSNTDCITHFNNFKDQRNVSKFQSHSVVPYCVRYISNNNNVDDKTKIATEEKPGLVARFKQMYKDYWYVLVPVHLVTSAFWFGSFYYVAKSGVDVIGLLQFLGVSDRFTEPLKDSSMGYFALAYALYKIATPIRYTVTLGGTTISIKYLGRLGYIKPLPSREELKEMYQVKKEGFQDMYQETKQELKQRKVQIKERKDHVMSDIARYKQEMREVKENELKNK